MKYKENWEDTEKRFRAWWDRSSIGRPMMKVVARSNEPCEALEEAEKPKTPEELYLNVDNNIKIYRNYCRTHKFMAESFPNFSVDLGPGSLALYLGSEPIFKWDTIWFSECMDELEKGLKIKIDDDNFWWKKHFELISRAKELAKNDFPVNIPDMIENIDIMILMRGTQNVCFDMMDEPETVSEIISRIDDSYFHYYDKFYNAVKGKDLSSTYTVFDIWSPGRAAKIQCDFSAMMSPGQYREFAQPSLIKQSLKLDNVLYHLDGPDAIKHVDAVMEIKDIDALQWTCGAGQPDGSSERWFPIYEKVRAAEKSLWIQIYDGGIDDWMKNAEKIVKTFGSDGIYLLFPEMEENEAKKLLERANGYWN
jgi:hypothetical protein